MLRSAFIAFIGGWTIWFWIDKPRSGLEQFLQTNDSMLMNFQHAFNLLKTGYLAQSYIFIWNAHYIVLSFIIGMALSVLYGFVSDYLQRKRLRSIMFPSSLSKNTNQPKEQTKAVEDSISNDKKQ